MCLHDFNLCSDKSWALSTLGSSRGGRAAGFLPVWRSLVGADSELKKKGKKKKGKLCAFVQSAAGGGREGSCGGASVWGITAAAIACSYTPGWCVRNFFKKKPTRFWRRRWRPWPWSFFFFSGGLADSFHPSKKEAEGAASQVVRRFSFYSGERQGVEHRVLCKLRMGSSAIWQAWELSHRPWVLWVGETFFLRKSLSFF